MWASRRKSGFEWLFLQECPESTGVFRKINCAIYTTWAQLYCCKWIKSIFEMKKTQNYLAKTELLLYNIFSRWRAEHISVRHKTLLCRTVHWNARGVLFLGGYLTMALTNKYLADLLWIAFPLFSIHLQLFFPSLCHFVISPVPAVKLHIIHLQTPIFLKSPEHRI